MAIDRKKYLDTAEVSQLRTVTEAHCIVDLKAGRLAGPLAWAVVDTALSTGLRVCELAALRVGDVDLKRGALRVVRRKRRKPSAETLAIGTDLVGHLREFIAWKELAGQPTGKRDALFVGKRGPLTAQGLMQLWKRAIARAGLPRELSIHSARHTLAVHLLDRTGNLRLVQKQLGHSSPVVTANLYADVPFAQMQEAVNGVYEDTAADRRKRRQKGS